MSFDLEGAACRDPEHCITCSDEGVPMRVLEPAASDAELARCEDGGGVEHEVETALVHPVPAGARVLVHAGVAIAVLEEEEGGRR
jgi:hydrogenase assembly chaperone HypC/HupF